MTFAVFFFFHHLKKGHSMSAASRILMQNNQILLLLLWKYIMHLYSLATFCYLALVFSHLTKYLGIIFFVSILLGFIKHLESIHWYLWSVLESSWSFSLPTLLLTHSLHPLCLDSSFTMCKPFIVSCMSLLSIVFSLWASVWIIYIELWVYQFCLLLVNPSVSL